MEMLSRFVLIVGLMMLSWQWVLTMPPGQIVPTIRNKTPDGIQISQPEILGLNTSVVMVQSIFSIDPSCPEGQFPSGPRHMCHRRA
ncbi:uncharacterized protein LOC128253693 [Drosophila gunungcola]|nr:uncharacterized protein LOC128253693 [Drosophila gunungcola]